MNDRTIRHRILTEFDKTFVVEAAAGTGKTTSLVRRIVALIEQGISTLDRMIAVTFTESAAGELKLRLRGEIETRLLHAGSSKAPLLAALPQLEEARIGTIHSLCSDLLREHPVEAVLDPRFEVAADGAQQRLFAQAFDRWFAGELQNPSPGIRRYLRRVQPRNTTARRQLLRAAAALAEWRDFNAPWRQDPFDRAGRVDRLVAEAEAVGAFASQGLPGDYLTRSLQDIERFCHDVARKEQGRPRDYDGLEADLSQLLSRVYWTPGRWKAEHRFNRNAVLRQRDALKEKLEAFCRDADAHLAVELQRDLQQMLFDYENLKEKAGVVDFQDLLIKARDLIREQPKVRGRLQQRYTHIFVDEFQDTDPLQAEVLILLSADNAAEADWRQARTVPGKLFIVGDPKQSIYRFRRADVTLYESIKQQLLRDGAEALHLQVSFRAVPELQEVVNAAFSERMEGQSAAQARYVPMISHRVQEDEGPPRIVALPVPRPYRDDGKMLNKAMEASYPDAVAAFVQWLLSDSGWTVTERDHPAPVPLQARHVCLLFKRFRQHHEDLTQPYVQALEARQIGHILVGGTSFHLREEVGAIRNALAAVEWPDDELSVFATLRGPLFGILDSELLAWKEQHGALHPYRIGEGAISDALRILQELHRGRNRRPVAVTISRLLSATRAHAGFAIWHSGEQALANVTRLMDLARQAEQDGLTSFRAFVEKLQDDAEHGEASEAPILEEGTGGVRLMTVHKAKGLEFPVVVLCDPTAGETNKTPSRWLDPERRLCALRLAGCSPIELLEHADQELERETEEAVRLLYVACTRARDLLVVPVVGDKPLDTWVGTLTPAVYPEGAPVGESGWCPKFGDDTVVDRPSNSAPTVLPGLHRPRLGTHRVVWWDPSVLRLDVRPTVGLRQDKLLTAQGNEAAAQAGIEAHEAWQAARQELRSRAAAPSVRVVLATDGVGDGEEKVLLETVGRKLDRPHGARFGTLVHAVLSRIDLSQADVAGSALLYGRILGATEAEQAAARDVVEAALSHPVMRAAARSKRCRREVPVRLPQADGSLLEGVVDLAYHDGEGWVVVDFKTDIELGDRLPLYQRQVQSYVEAIRQASREPARGVLLQV